MRKVAVLALPDCRYAGLAATLDLCRLANVYTGALFSGHEGPRAAMGTHVLTPDGGAVRFADHRAMSADGAIDVEQSFDVVYLASFEVESEAALEHRLAASGEVRAWLIAQRGKGAKLAAAGAAVLVLAETGLLDGGEAAAPPEHAALMRRRFPRVRTDAVGALAHWSGVHTAAVLGAEPSLAMRVLEDAFSRNLGDHLTKLTQISDADFGAEEAEAGALDDDEVVRRAQLWLQQRFTGRCVISELAAAVAVSQKALTRRFKQRLGVTPQGYLQRLRIETAKRQLTHTNRRVERIAVLVGYNDVGFFKEKFLEITGMSPSSFRSAARARGEKGRKLGSKET